MGLFIGTTVIGPMGLQRILPQPVDTQAVQGGLHLTVTVPPGTHDAMLRLMLLPAGAWPKQLVARLDGHAGLRWTQVAVP